MVNVNNKVVFHSAKGVALWCFAHDLASRSLPAALHCVSGVVHTLPHSRQNITSTWQVCNSTGTHWFSETASIMTSTTMPDKDQHASFALQKRPVHAYNHTSWLPPTGHGAKAKKQRHPA